MGKKAHCPLGVKKPDLDQTTNLCLLKIEHGHFSFDLFTAGIMPKSFLFVKRKDKKVPRLGDSRLKKKKKKLLQLINIFRQNLVWFVNYS